MVTVRYKVPRLWMRDYPIQGLKIVLTRAAAAHLGGASTVFVCIGEITTQLQVCVHEMYWFIPEIPLRPDDYDEIET